MIGVILSVISLYKSDIWFNGPLFLKDSKDWPKSKVEYTSTDYKDEIKTPALTCLMLNENSNNLFDDIKHYDSYKRLQRIIAFILKFRYSFSRKIHKADLLHKAEIIVIKLIQSKFNIASKINNDLVSLTPFIDSDGIIRVGGRLQNSTIPFDSQHPILLPKCELSKSLMRGTHKLNYHAGPQTLLSIMREKYWILSGKRLASKFYTNV